MKCKITGEDQCNADKPLVLRHAKNPLGEAVRFLNYHTKKHERCPNKTFNYTYNPDFTPVQLEIKQ